MNELLPKTLEGEIIAPGDGVWVIGRARPFEARRDKIKLPAGLTVAELLDAALDGKHSGVAEYLVYIDGVPVPYHMHDRVRVKTGHTVTFAPRLSGGGARNIAMLGVAVLGLIASIVATAFLGPLAGALIGAGIAIGGGILVNALFPIAPPTTSAIEDQRKGLATTFSITGSQNVADPYGPVPFILGRVRVWPRLGARSYVTFSGTDQYLRMLLVVGYGPLDISDIRIGETPIAEFQDVTVQTYSAWEPGDDLDQYTRPVFQEPLSIALTNDVGNQVRLTATNITRIETTVTMPNGWYKIDPDTGDRSGRDVNIRADYRAVGDVSWTEFGVFDENGYQRNRPRVIGFNVDVDEDQYEVRVRKASGDSENENVVEDLFWTALTSMRDGDPILFNKPLALIECRVKATGQLSGNIDTLNCLAEARVTAYTGGSPEWTEATLSRNPADAFRWALQGPAISEPVPDEQIDLDTLAAWWAFCDEAGYEFNLEHGTRSSVFELLQMIAATGKARVTRTDGIWGVIWDALEVPVAQHFTPRNSWGFAEQRIYFDPPHALRVNFVNEDNGYTGDELRVYSAGFDSSNATKFEAIEFPGVTDPAQIADLAEFQLLQARARPSTYTLTTNWQSISCTTGDRVYCAHDAILIGTAQARVTGVSGSTFTLDEAVTFAADTAYSMRFRQADGTSVIRLVTTPVDLTTNQVQLESEFPLADPEVGDLVMIGEAFVGGPAQLLRVRDIEWLPDLRARLTLVDDISLGEIRPARLTQTNTFYAPTVAGETITSLIPARLTNSNTLYEPTLVNYILQPAVLSQTDTFYGPAIGSGEAYIAISFAEIEAAT